MQVPVFVKDLAERAVKTFAGGVITGLAVTPGGVVTTGFTSFPWAHALDIGLGATVVSIVFSLASFKFGDTGTASAVNLDNQG